MASDEKELKFPPDERSEQRQEPTRSRTISTREWKILRRAVIDKRRAIDTGEFSPFISVGDSLQVGEPMNILGMFGDISQKLVVNDAVDAHEEHERTRELITEKLSTLADKHDVIIAKEEIIWNLERRITDLEERLKASTEELAKTREVEECEKRMIGELRVESKATRDAMSAELADLRRYLSKFAPHKRFLRVTSAFLLFFSASMLVNSAFGIRIIEPFWGAIGVGLSLAMLVVIYFGMKDVESGPTGSERN
jgi:hypothetical protein